MNIFKQALKAGRVQIGLWCGFADPYPTEIVAGAGFDWLALDCEHAPNDLRTVLAQLQAMAGTPAQAVVRLPTGDPVLIKQYLDIGAHTLLVPMVESAEQAAMLVAATRYPPKGFRGVATGRASRWGRVKDYLSTAAEVVCLLIQVESKKGLDNLDALLAVEGVDGVFIGPADLSASLGHLGDPRHPDVAAAIENAISRIKAAGKAVGILSTDSAQAQSYIDQGVTFCAVGIDTLILSSAVMTLARKFKPELMSPP